MSRSGALSGLLVKSKDEEKVEKNDGAEETEGKRKRENIMTLMMMKTGLYRVLPGYWVMELESAVSGTNKKKKKR